MNDNVPVVEALAGFLVGLTNTQRALAALAAAVIVGVSIGVTWASFRGIPARVERAEQTLLQHTAAIAANVAGITELRRGTDELIEGQRRLCRLILEREEFTESQIDQACGRAR